MKAKKFLKRYSKNKKMILNKFAELEHWRSLAMQITSVMNGERVQTSGNNDKMAEAVAECVIIEGEIFKSIKDLRVIEKNILNAIEQLSGSEYDVLHKIYVESKDLTTVSIECDKSYSWVKSVHKMALANLQRIIDKKVNIQDERRKKA